MPEQADARGVTAREEFMLSTHANARRQIDEVMTGVGSVAVEVEGLEQLKCYRLALGARSPVLVHPGVYQETFAKKSGPRTPRPPGGPPVLGSLVWSAEGLPSTRNRPFRWPLPPTSPPQVIGDTQDNVSRQLAGVMAVRGGAAPAPPLAGSGRSCASSIRLA
jgi:hypothetical protein